MGLTEVRVVVENPEASASKEVELAVDTGSAFTWISRRACSRESGEAEEGEAVQDD